MSVEPTNLEKIRRLPWQIAGNAFNTMFCVFSFFGSVFVLFLSELNFDKTQIGFLLSLLPFCGLTALFTASKIARFGFKRTFLLFYSLRQTAVIMLLFTPFALTYTKTFTKFDLTFFWIAGIVLFFSICRAIAETAVTPWSQEFIPSYIRGKFTAVNGVISTVFSITATATAGYLIGHYTGINRFLVIFGAGSVLGLLGVWCFSFTPGGAPIRDTEAKLANFRTILDSLKDLNYRTYLIGMALVSLGTVPLFSFSPLFMKEQVGIATGTVVFLDIAGALGTLITYYLWGWASDRYGSKPVMFTGLSMLVLLPLILFCIPRHSAASIPCAMAMSFFCGMSNTGWLTGYSRYLYVNAVPADKKTPYMAVFYAWSGLIAGTAPLLAGRLLDLFKGISGEFFIFRLDSFTPLFLISFCLLFAGLVIISKVRSDGAIPARKFVGMFLQGNPFIALESLVRYGWARDEADRVSLTERMGDSKNPLSSHELIEALGDPSFSVRYEAIISISRLPPEQKLIDALLLVLVGNEPDLSIAAAWALGKLGDKSAILPLRETLLSEFQLLQTHSARALAKLGDTGSVPFFLEKIRTEPNAKLRLGYASALGTLRCEQASPDLLTLMKTLDDPILRGEVALDLARIVGPERYFIQLWRSTHTEAGTSLAQAMIALTRELEECKIIHGEVLTLAKDTATRFAENDMVQAVALLSVFLRKFPQGVLIEPAELIIRQAAEQLTETGASRIEYILLALHTLHVFFQNPRPVSALTDIDRNQKDAVPPTESVENVDRPV